MSISTRLLEEIVVDGKSRETLALSLESSHLFDGNIPFSLGHPGHVVVVAVNCQLTVDGFCFPVEKL